MRNRWHAGAVLIAAFALTGCPEQKPPTDDAGVTEDAGVTVSPVEMCERIAAAHCGLIQRCYIAFAGESESECRQLRQSECLERYTQLKPSFEANKVEIDAEKVASCEQRMQTSACVPSFPPGYFNFVAIPFSDCTLDSGLLKGKVASGSTCVEGVECQPGTACLKPGGVCTGTCSSVSKEGEPCGFACEQGLYCDAKGTEDPVDDRCAAPKGVNEVCESSVECQPNLWCDGTCKQRGSVGDKCRFDPERLSTCAPGLACDVVPHVPDQVGTCIVPLGQGERCRYHWSCAPGLVCFDLDFSEFPANPPEFQGVCGPPAPADETCPFTPYAIYLGDQCGSGTHCSAQGVCETRPQLGEACNPFSQACSGNGVYCKPSETAADQGTCTGAAGLNERCASKLQSGQTIQIPCQAGWCDTETTLKCLPPDKDVGQECASNGECLSGRCAVQEDRTLRCANACL